MPCSLALAVKTGKAEVRVRAKKTALLVMNRAIKYD